MDILSILLAFCLVLLNGFFVATEFAIVKVRPSRIEELIRSKRSGAQGVRHMVTHLDAYLSATQLGITFASLGLGWLGEPAFARLVEWPLMMVGVEDPVWIHRIAMVFAFGTISFLHIVIGELAPKSLALLRAESVAVFAAYPMRVFHTLFYPFIYVLNGVSTWILKCTGLIPDGIEGDLHSEEELKIILAQARSAGLLAGPRAEVLQKAIELSTKTARHMMVPRNEVIVLDINAKFSDNLERVQDSEHSRFPLCDRELDHALGVVHIRDLLNMANSNPDGAIQDIATPIFYFPEIMRGDRLLSEFPKRDGRMAIVVDEYGGASGILTSGDIVGSVMGDLVDSIDTDVVTLPSGAYEVEGVAEIDEIEDLLNLDLELDDITTVAGFMMQRLGRMPIQGDQVREAGFIFQITEIAGPKVKKVKIQPTEPPSTAGGASPKSDAT
jgi:CBS domain containing-hemolysin-like protein